MKALPSFLIVTITCVLLSVIVSPATRAATAAQSVGPSGHRLITMQNAALKVVIDLDLGARIVEYDYAPFGQNLVYAPDSNGGILMDHVWEQTWPGEFLRRKYDADVVDPGPGRAVVRVHTVGQGDTIKGIRLERTLTLTGDSRVLDCKVSLINQSDSGRVTGYWSQNNLDFLGNSDNTTWYRPATRGVDVYHVGDPWHDIVDDTTAGWCGVADSRVPGGLAFLMDYNDLWRLYDCAAAVTTEWFCDKVAIPAGKAWTTDIVIIPTKGNHGYKYASRNVVANFVVDEMNGSIKITHELSQGLQPLKDVTVSTKVYGLKSQWTATSDAKLPALDESVVSVPTTVTGTGSLPAGVQVTITGHTPDGQVVTDTYTDYYGGSFGKNNDPFSMQPLLKVDRPAKNKVFLKPDVIKYVPNATPRILYLRGIWHQQFKIDDAIAADFPNAIVDSGWLRASPVGLGFSQFPADYPSLLSYDLIILGNVPAAPFDLVGQEMLADYVAAGGNVLILGGDRSYGQSDFTNPRLLSAMPVEFGGHYNWDKIPGGGVLKTASVSPVTDGVSFGAHDTVFFSHHSQPKKGSQVLVSASGRPVLVTGATAAGGRIACILATPFGEAVGNQTAYWDSPAWTRLTQNMLAWLVKR